MNYAIVLMLAVVVISTNVSATLITGENQMSAFAQRETNTDNVTSERIQEQNQLNADIRSQVDSNSREDRPSREVDSRPVPEENVVPTNTQDDSLTSSTEIPNTQTTESGVSTEIGNSNPDEIGNSNPDEVGVTDSNIQSQDISESTTTDSTTNTAAALDPRTANTRDEDVQEIINKARDTINKAKGFNENVVKPAKNLIDAAIATFSKDPTKASAVVLRLQVDNALRIIKIARALDTVPVCNPGDPTCTPPEPTEEPANCDPLVSGNCFPVSGESPCTPALVSGATCKSGDIECTQTLLEHDILCQAEYPDGTTWQGVYFTPPGLTPQFSEQLCTPNPNPPPFKNCEISFF
jgi:hypothetical protein